MVGKPILQKEKNITVSKYSYELKCKTDPQWIKAVMADFDAFLIDHAANET